MSRVLDRISIHAPPLPPGHPTRLRMTQARSDLLRWVVFAASPVLLSAVTVPAPHGWLGAALAAAMVAIAVIDARSFIIPDWLVLTALALGLIDLAFGDDFDAGALLEALLRGAMPALAFAALRFGYGRWRGHEGMGLGDVKLAFVAGVWLDWFAIATAIELAALAALAGVGFAFLRTRELTRATPIPFGLYFAPSIWLAWLIQSLIR